MLSNQRSAISGQPEEAGTLLVRESFLARTVTGIPSRVLCGLWHGRGFGRPCCPARQEACGPSPADLGN
jgi:hypothetical protein